MLAINMIDGGVAVVDLDIQPNGNGGLNGDDSFIVFGPIYSGSLHDRVQKALDFIEEEG